MRVSASPETIRFIQEQGGKVYVSSKRVGCCGGAKIYLETATEPGETAFRRVGGEGIDVFLDERLREPEDLELALQGRRRKRVDAYWNGCAYVI